MFRLLLEVLVVLNIFWQIAFHVQNNFCGPRFSMYFSVFARKGKGSLDVGIESIFIIRKGWANVIHCQLWPSLSSEQTFHPIPGTVKIQTSSDFTLDRENQVIYVNLENLTKRHLR